MRAFILTALACLLVIALVSCGDQEPVTQPEATADFDKDPPAQSGPQVVRYGDEYYWFFSDVDAGLSIVVGLDVMALCQEGVWEMETYEFQDITHSQDQAIVNQLIHGDDVMVTVWPLLDGYCWEFLEYQPIAWGTMDLVATDNDLYAWMNDHNRTNSYGFAGHGQLETADGMANVNAVFRVLWPGGDAIDELRWVVSNVHLAYR